MKYHKIILLAVILILTAFSSCKNSNKSGNEESLSNWLKKNSYEIETLALTEHYEDMEPLGQIVGNAKFVCLGESRHDIREQFQLKHRFIKYLVEEKDFSIFILEASMPYAELINAYLQNGEGNIDDIMANMPGWFLWDTEEISVIINWMRAYNMDTENVKKLQFYGIDIVAPAYGLNSIFEYLKKVDSGFYKKFQTLEFGQDQMDDSSWQSTLQRFSAFPSGDKEMLRNNYRVLHSHILNNESAYISLSNNKEYDWILRLAYCAQEACRMFTGGSRMEMGLIRDSAMADNALWIKRFNSDDDKSILWAHNVHITMGEFSMTGESESIKGMGYILGEELKSDMVSIGASFNRGLFQGQNRSFSPADESTMDGAFAKIGMKYGLIDLQALTKSKTVIDWLNADQDIQGQEFIMTCIPANSFNAIFFVDSISRTIPNPVSQSRFQNMN